MKLKEALKERVKERINEATTSSGAYRSGSTNHARYTPAGQTRTLKIAQLSGYMQVEEPVAEDPMPADSLAEGPNVYMDKKINYKHNNKIRRDADGELTASGMPGDAYASPQEYVDDHTQMDHQETAQARGTV